MADRRFTLLYRYSTDGGVTWHNISDAVDSLQTKITHNLCTNNFTSAKDEATFVMPATKLTEKKDFVDALLGPTQVLVEIRGTTEQVTWDGEDVLWNGKKVLWREFSYWFLGYVDKSSIDLKSYPLPVSVTVKLQDISVLHLDDAPKAYILYENYRISRIVRSLLIRAGYSYDDSLDPSTGVLAVNGDDTLMEAFVIDKADKTTYRQYIDLLLFEAGGYVLDFTEDGTARVVRLPWESPVAARVIDNPMNANGIATRSTWLANDGVSLKWSTLKWSSTDQILWMDSISRSLDNHGNVLQGEIVHNNRYWPDGGELSPTFMEYQAEMLDKPYLTRESRKQNKDLSIIMAKNVYAYIQATKNGSEFTSWAYDIPADPEFSEFSVDPTAYPKKAWWLLHNTSGGDVDIQFFTLRGTALYRAILNTMLTDGSENPKEYESTYIYDETQAERFIDFYWHFLQTSRNIMSWSEPYTDTHLNTVVSITHKGQTDSVMGVVISKTIKFLNENTPTFDYQAVGVSTFASQTVVNTADMPDGSSRQGAKGDKGDKGDTGAQGPQGPAGTPAVVWDFEMSAETYVVNHRLPGNNNAITLKADIQGISPAPTPNWQVVDAGGTSRSTWLSGTSGASVTLTIPYDNAVPWPLEVRMSDPGNVQQTIRKNLTGIDETNYSHNFGGWTPYDDGSVVYILPDHYTDANGIDYDVINGDYFVSKGFSTSGTLIVGPTGNPYEKGYYERGGAGTTARPYFYFLSTDETVVAGKDYYTPGGDNYINGVPYIYGIPTAYSWKNEMQGTSNNADKMLGCLANVLSNPSIQPKVEALYGWFKNLTALYAVITHLTSRNLLVSDAEENPTFEFMASAFNDDGTRRAYPLFYVKYNGNVLFQIDSQHGTIQMTETTIDGNFTSNGFATSEAASSLPAVSMAVTELTQYYQPWEWVDAVIYDSAMTYVRKMTSADMATYSSIGMDTSYMRVNESEIYTFSGSGTFMGTAFSSIMYATVDPGIRGIYKIDAIVSGGKLYIGAISASGATHFPTAQSSTYPSSVTMGTTHTWTDGGIWLGYLLTSSFLSGKISTYGLPAGSELEIISGSLSVNGTTIDPTSTLTFMIITSSSLRVYTKNSQGNITSDTTFSEGNYYGSNAFNLSSIGIATSKDGIKTKHIVPMAGPSYDIGTPGAPYGNVYANKYTGALVNADGDGSVVYGAVFN